ncbi:hypothetical protein WJX79_000145 [Trebouxia sp. C0005]
MKGMQLTGNAWNDWPCNLASTGEMGRFLVASTPIDRAQVVLLSEAYLTALIPSYKKRICHYCLEDHQKRLTVCCKRCNQAWYCSPQCQHAHWAGQPHAVSEGPSLQSPASSNSPSSFSPCHLPPPPTSRSVCAHTRHMVPHSLTCAVLKRFSSIKCDSSMESVVRMCLDAMALQLLNTQAGAAALADHPSFSKTSLYDAESELLDMVGRIVSNNFGIYTSRQRQQLHHSHAAAQEDGASAGEASLRSALQSASSLHIGNSGEEPTRNPRDHLLPLATPKPASSSQNVMPWPMQADTDQLVRPDSMSPPHGNSTADVCGTRRLFPAIDSAVGGLSVGGVAQCCTQQSKSSAPWHTEAELSQVQRGRAASGIHKAKEDVVGREMYITASFFNHSCEPNCIKKRVHGHSGLASVTALRDIKAGEALTISYIDLELPRSARQLELKTSFFFDCKCVRCETELTEGSKKCSYIASQSQCKSQAPKRRGLKARVSRQ